MAEQEAWTADEVLAYLAEKGKPISRVTWHSYVSRKQAPAADPALKVGRTPRWRPDHIREWQESRPGQGGPNQPRGPRRHTPTQLGRDMVE